MSCSTLVKYKFGALDLELGPRAKDHHISGLKANHVIKIKLKPVSLEIEKDVKTCLVKMIH